MLLFNSGFGFSFFRACKLKAREQYPFIFSYTVYLQGSLYTRAATVKITHFVIIAGAISAHTAAIPNGLILYVLCDMGSDRVQRVQRTLCD